MRPWWRRVLLLLPNLFLPGAGLVWIGRYRQGFAVIAASLLLLLSPSILPDSRGNELLDGMLLLLVVVGVVGAFIWSMVVQWTASRFEMRPFPQRWHWPFWVAVPLCLALFSQLQSRPFHSFYLPSESMEPTLLVNDKVWADMRPMQKVKRGDIVVFKLGAVDWNGRVMAFGGERIAMVDGVPVINGKPVEQQQMSTKSVSGPRLLRETLPNRVSYLVQDIGTTPQDTMAERIVPVGTVFILRDNRDKALDSRFARSEGGNGVVPMRDVIGRFFLIFWSADRSRIGRPLP